MACVAHVAGDGCIDMAIACPDCTWVLAPLDHVTPTLPRVLRPGVTACIVAHPARFNLTGGGGNGKLNRALQSVMRQNRQPDAIIVVNDIGREGAAAMRQRILDMVDTEWLAWLDSDDEWYPEHLEALMQVATATGAQFVFPYFDAPSPPFDHFGIPFDPATPYHTTITFLIRTDLARRVGFSTDAAIPGYANDDWAHILGVCKIMADEGIPAVALAERTWYYHMDGLNSCGVPGQGDAV